MASVIYISVYLRRDFVDIFLQTQSECFISRYFLPMSQYHALCIVERSVLFLKSNAEKTSLDKTILGP